MRIHPLVVAALAALFAVPAGAQSYSKHHFTGGLGAAMPRKELAPFYQTAFGWMFGYGYRPWRYLQLDIGLDSSYNAADVNDYYNSPAFGPIRIRDFQFMVPYGARAVLPLAGGRAELFGGGGGVYLRYSELLNQPSNYYRVDCPACSARSGNGWYAVAGGNVALDRGGHFRLGVTVRGIDGYTEGRSVGALPPVRTEDQWLNVFGTFTFSF